ncbi:MAG: tetratricopeptide repeat protein, partial [Thermoanaerobaculia bacterium]
MNTPTDWVAPIAILAGGLILGLLFVWFFGRRKASAPSIGSDRDLEVKDLVAKRDALIAQLRELDTDSQLAPDQLARERSRLELETAEVLRALDQHKPGKGGRGSAAPAAAAVEAPAFEESAPASAMNPALKGFLWGTLSVALIATLAWFVTKDSTPREPEGAMTGGQPAMGAPGQPNPVVLQLEEAVKKSPEDLELRTNLAQAYLESDNLMGVFEQTKYVLERSPEHSRALTFQALVRVAMGEMPAALQMLDKATKSDPKNMDGWLALAWIQTQNDETAKADQTIASAVKASPEEKQRIEATYAEMKRVNAQMAKQPGGATAAGGQMPEGHPPIDGKPAPAQTTTMT